LAKVLGLAGIVVAGFFFSRHDYVVTEGQVREAKDRKLILEVPGQQTPRTFDIGPSSKVLLNNKDQKETKDKKKEKNTIDDLPQGASVKVITSKENSNQVLQVQFKDDPGFGLFAFAMVLIFLTYGGWSDAAFVAAEVRNRRRNIPLALFLGTAGVTVIYLLVNGAYLAGLGFERAQESKEVAAEVLKLLPWQYGE